LYARLYTLSGGGYRSAGDVSFQAAAGQATLTFPRAGQADVDTTQPFTWAPFSTAQGYYLTVGTTEGGYDLVNTGPLASSMRSVRVPDLPVGKTLYARLYTEMDGRFERFDDVVFRAQAGKAALTNPSAGARAGAHPGPLTWTAVAGATGYDVTIGTAPGRADVVDSGLLPPATTTYPAPALPLAKTLYAAVYTVVPGGQVRVASIAFST
jgi:hypothetical protein